MSLLAVGTQAPEFTTTDQDGKTHTLGDFKGKKVILYFYPKQHLWVHQGSLCFPR